MDSANQIMNATMPVADRANSQPKLVTTQSNPTPEAVFNVAGLVIPQATKARTTTAAMPNTDLSRVPGRS